MANALACVLFDARTSALAVVRTFSDRRVFTVRDLVGFARSVDAQSLVEKTPSLMPLEPSQAGPILSPGELSDALSGGMLLPCERQDLDAQPLWRAPGRPLRCVEASEGQLVTSPRRFLTSSTLNDRVTVEPLADWVAMRNVILSAVTICAAGAEGRDFEPGELGLVRGRGGFELPFCRVVMPPAPSATPPGPLLRRLSAAGGVLRATEADRRGLSLVSLCLGPAEGLGPRLLALLDRAFVSHELSVVPVYGGLVREPDCATAQLWATLCDHGKGRVFRCEECSGVAASDTRKRRRFCSNACKQAYIRRG